MIDAVAEKYPDYEIEDRSVALTELPLWVWIGMVIFIVIPAGIFALLQPGDAGFDLTGWSLVYVVVLMLVHEGTHAIAWKWASKLPWGTFRFGAEWRALALYCHSKEPMAVIPYRIGAIMPLIITGIVPWVISLMNGNFDLAIASSLLISGAFGDIFILWSIRDLPNFVLLQDHDSKAGCIVLWPKEQPIS